MQSTVRLQKLQSLLPSLDCDAIVITNPIDLYYLLGISLSLGYLLVTPKNAQLIVDGRYFEMCQQKTQIAVIPSEKSPFPNLLTDPSYRSIKTLGFDQDKTYFQTYTRWKDALPQVTLKPIQSPVADLRLIKDPSEIELLREAAVLGSQGFDFVCNLLQEGVSEKEMALELEIFWKRSGGEGTSFDPIIAFGSHSSMPHYRAGTGRLQRGDPVLIDIGVTKASYHSDMTRTVFFGAPSEQLSTIYEVVREAQNKALEIAKPGTTIGALDRAARDFIESKGYGEYFTHSLGHGIGLEVHESPIIRDKAPYNQMTLKSGMAITIEPGIYLAGIGGIRIEDTIIITDKGFESLTQRPTTLFIVNAS